MGRSVLIRRPQLHGNVSRMVQATVLSETKDSMRVLFAGQNRPVVVKASDSVDAPAVFGTRLAMQRGVVIQKALPDNPNSLSRICERRGF